MTYAVKQDLVYRFGTEEMTQLSDHGGAGDIDDDVVARALADADDEINGYLASRYALPLASAPKILTLHACDIARYRLYKDRPTDSVRSRYEDAVKYLRAVGEGKLSLGLDQGGAEVTTETGIVDYSLGADERVFTRDTLADY